MASTTLGSKAVGSIVTIKVNGTAQTFIVATKLSRGVGLILKNIWTTNSWSAACGTECTKFYNKIESTIKSQIIQQSAGNVFLLNQVEAVGGWSYFSTAGSRVAYYNGTAAAWWLRDTEGFSMGERMYMATSGYASSYDPDEDLGVRPALVLPTDLLVAGDGSVQANSAPTTPSSITIPSTIKGGATITVRWGSSSDTNGNLAGYKVERSTDGGNAWSQIYQGTATSTTNAVAFGTSKVTYRVKAYDDLGLESGYKTSSTVTVINNTAPGTPSSITVPSSVMGGTTITISWGSATDSEGNLAGYKVERSTDGGSDWSQIYQGTSTSTTNAVAFGTSTVMYRVKAYDTYDAESGYITSDERTVINNHAPSAPTSISVPVSPLGGSTLSVIWGSSTDEDGDLSGYKLERSVDGASYVQLYAGTALSYTDTITKGWTSVQYRVKAYDPYSESSYTTSAKRTVINNTAPTITCSASADLGTKTSGFSVSYSVGDVDTSDTLTVTETLDGTAKRTFTATRGTNYSFALTGTDFQKVLNGSHTMVISVTDGTATTKKTFTFKKSVTSASITLKSPLEVSGAITAAALQVIGSIPSDATLSVKVTNNAKDSSPVWQDATAEVKKGTNIAFTNTTATNGWALNFKVEVKEGSSGTAGYIIAVVGAFM